MSSPSPLPPSSDDFQVHLRPLFGIHPKYYLAGIYGIICVAVLFVIFVLPGLTNPGSRVSITSTPPGAAVVWHGKDWGVTPLTAYLPQGTGKLVIQRPGFSSYESDYTSQSSLFFSLFFPRTDRIKVSLKTDPSDDLEKQVRREAGRWQLAAPFTDNYQFPLIFTQFHSDADAAGWDQSRQTQVLVSLQSLVVDHQMYLDYGRALGLWALGATPPPDLKSQTELWKPILHLSPSRIALWVLANQSRTDRDRELTEPSDWLRSQLEAVRSTLVQTSSTGASPRSVTVLGTAYRGVAGRTWNWGSDKTSLSFPNEAPYSLPVAAQTLPFYMAEHDVTQGEFYHFVQTTPSWAPAARDQLISSGLASQDYLSDWKDGRPASLQSAVVDVSWYAAQAYVDWLNTSGHLPHGLKAALPNEAQWEAAALSSKNSTQENWDWTSSAWDPSGGLTEDHRPLPFAADSYARAIRGGVAGLQGDSELHNRAGWPAASSTPKLGFRVILTSQP